MHEGFMICTNWKAFKEIPNLQTNEILDKVSDTVLEMAVENGKMARILHEVLLRIFQNSELSKEDITYLREVITGILGRDHADSFAKEKHED